MNLTRCEVIEQIDMKRRGEHCFVRTWEAGHTFVDIDLIDRFIARGWKSGALDGFELLDLEQAWQTLIALDPDRLSRVKSPKGETIEWVWKDSQGKEHKTLYPFTPEGIMTIIDDELFA